MLARKSLAHLAFNSEAAYRRVPSSSDQEFLDSINDPLAIDIVKILNCKAIRRLQEKAQVFPMPDSPHVRDRMTHTHEVVGLSIILADALRLNTNLCQAIALAHDLGHAPLGHAGEERITELSGRKFRHEIFSCILVQEIERKGLGLNLCHQVIEGIFYHSRGSGSMVRNENLLQEYNVVMYADKIAYVFADLNDLLIRYHLKIDSAVLQRVHEIFGPTQRTSVNTCIKALVEESADLGFVSFQRSTTAQEFEQLKQWMYANVYPGRDRWAYGCQQLGIIYDFIANSPYFADCDPAVVLALLTDREVMELAQILITPLAPRPEQIRSLGVMEIVPYLKNKQFDLSSPGLDW